MSSGVTILMSGSFCQDKTRPALPNRFKHRLSFVYEAYAYPALCSKRAMFVKFNEFAGHTGLAK